MLVVKFDENLVEKARQQLRIAEADLQAEMVDAAIRRVSDAVEAVVDALGSAYVSEEK